MGTFSSGEHVVVSAAVVVVLASALILEMSYMNDDTPMPFIWIFTMPFIWIPRLRKLRLQTVNLTCPLSAYYFMKQEYFFSQFVMIQFVCSTERNSR
jgi:hypothetical protein